MPTLRARWVLPIDGPPIEHGEVVVEEGAIASVGPRSRAAGPDCVDFGEAAILPGLVNAHSHLEYTALRGFLEDIPFFPWIRALTAIKKELSPEDWRASTELGALECIAAGTTTLGDNTDTGASVPVAIRSGLRAVAYQEVFGIDHREPVEPIIAALCAKVAALRAEVSSAGAEPRICIGVSPHAPYTVRPALFSALAQFLGKERLPVSIHVAESPAESALIQDGSGPFAEMYSRRGILWQAPGVTPTRYLHDQGMLEPNTLLVHAVHQTEDDIALMASSGASVVHCPKSNAKLGAGIAPLGRWLKAPSLRVALGTDSAVSNNTLDLFEEMRFALYLQRAKQEAVEVVGAQQVLTMATLGGARALGLSDRVGRLAVGLSADLIAVRLDRAHTCPAKDPYAALVYSARADDVCCTMVDGRILYRDGAWQTLDGARICREASALSRRLANDHALHPNP